MTNRPTPKPAQLVADARVAGAQLRIYHGRAEDWEGGEKIDLVFTNPYGPLPRSLAGKPMIVHQWCHRTEELARWCHVAESDLGLLSKWNGGREAFYAVNLEHFPVDVERFKPEPGGWYPPDLVAIMLGQFWMYRWYDPAKEEERRSAGFIIWDGFMGRGTIAREVIMRGGLVDYVGVEELSQHIDLSLAYLGLRPEW